MSDKAMRFSAGKPEVDYILHFPRSLTEVSRVLEEGAKKYAKYNWKLGGKPDEEYLGACVRHMLKFVNEGEFDKESGCHHLAHAAWNLLTLLELNRSKQLLEKENERRVADAS